VNRFGHLIGPLAVLVFALAFGTIGYILVEHWSFLDAFFMTVTTITTVGYGEVHPLSPAGQVFTIVLILLGVGAVLYTLSDMFGWLLATNWGEQRRFRQMEQAIASLDHHYILCGYGRVGQSVARVLRGEHARFVVIDVAPESIGQAVNDGFLVVQGDAANDEVLKQARIDRAAGLITAVQSDAGNVYVVLSAKGLRPDLPIVARASSEDAVAKLLRAGANHVISPYAIAGERMGMLAVRPSSVELVETLLQAGHQSLVLEEVAVSDASRLSGATIAALRHQFPEGPSFVGIRADGTLVSPPSNDYRLRLGDVVVVVGSPDQIRKFERSEVR
jgi:voltage-gated potassium channel